MSEFSPSTYVYVDGSCSLADSAQCVHFFMLFCARCQCFVHLLVAMQGRADKLAFVSTSLCMCMCVCVCVQLWF